MQKLDNINYKNKLSESVGLSKESKKGAVHYFDDNKIQRWYVFEESEAKDILAYAQSPEELVSRLGAVEVSNMKEFNTILKYRASKSLKESAANDRLFYLDTLYGPKNHQLRKVLTENQQMPTGEKTYDQIMQELDAYPGAPAPYPQGSPTGQPQGQPQGSMAPTQGVAGGPIVGAAGANEIDFILSDLFDDVLSRIKGLRTEVYAEDEQRKIMAHYFYENLYEMREKIITALKERIAEQTGQVLPGQQPAQPVGGPQQPTPGV